MTQQQKQSIAAITRGTLVPLSLAAAAVCASWHLRGALGTECERINANAAAIERNCDEIKEIKASQAAILRSLIRMETKLGTLPGNRGNERDAG